MQLVRSDTKPATRRMLLLLLSVCDLLLKDAPLTLQSVFLSPLTASSLDKNGKKKNILTCYKQ